MSNTENWHEYCIRFTKIFNIIYLSPLLDIPNWHAAILVITNCPCRL